MTGCKIKVKKKFSGAILLSHSQVCKLMDQTQGQTHSVCSTLLGIKQVYITEEFSQN